MPGWMDQIRERGDGFAMWLFILFACFVGWLVGDGHGWPLGLLVFILLMVVWELAYRLTRDR